MKILLLEIIGVFISTLIGMSWYSPKTPMGKIHMEAIGLTEPSKKKSMWKYYLLQMFLSLLTSTFIASIMLVQKKFGSEIIYFEIGFVWLCFTVPMIGQSLLWGNYDKKSLWKKFFSDILMNLITYFVIIFAFSFIV